MKSPAICASGEQTCLEAVWDPHRNCKMRVADVGRLGGDVARGPRLRVPLSRNGCLGPDRDQNISQRPSLRGVKEQGAGQNFTGTW